MEEVYELAGIGHVQNRVIKIYPRDIANRWSGSIINWESGSSDFRRATVGLDQSSDYRNSNLIREMGKSKTIIFSSHILSEVQAICERVIVLNDGKIAADVTPKTCTTRHIAASNYIASIEGEPESVLNALKQVPQVINVCNCQSANLESMSIKLKVKAVIFAERCSLP